jgi:hypothetical protein
MVAGSTHFGEAGFMNVRAALLSNVSGYLAREVSLASLEEWVVGHLLALLNDRRDSTYTATGEIELGLAEIGDDVLSEEEFRHRLDRTLREAPITIDLREGSSVRTGSSSGLHVEPVAHLGPSINSSEMLLRESRRL